MESTEESLGEAKARRSEWPTLHFQIVCAEASCGSILEFTRRDFEALAALAPELADACVQLENHETKLCDLASHVRNMESLVQRMQAKEKLRVVFIGPLKAGKSTLINMLLSTKLLEYEMLLPVDNKALGSSKGS